MTTDGNCGECGSSLVREKWNSVTDIVFCGNRKCRLSHVPVSNLAPRVSEHKRGLKVPEWLEGPHSSKDNSKGSISLDFQARLGRLRRYIYTEDEED